MKKIAIFTLGLGYGGVEKYFSSLCKMLEDDYEIEIISTYKVLDKPAFYFNKNIKIKYLMDFGPNTKEVKECLKKHNLINTIKECCKAIKILYLKYTENIKAIRNIKSDYVITTRSFHNNLVSKFKNKKVIKIATDHNYHNNDFKYINSLIKSCKNFDYFIAVSKSLYNSYKERFTKTKCIYIPNVIDKKPRSVSKLENNTLIAIGRLVEEKGFSDLISVVDLVRQHISDVKLHLIGDGYLLDTLKQKVKELKLENNVILHGYLDKKEIEKHMLDSSIYVMTSLTESFGLVLVEAMSYGLPCVAYSSAAGACELINDKNGILVDGRDRYEMARNIIDLLNNKKKREKLGVGGRNTSDYYLSKNVKNEWLNILK